VLVEVQVLLRVGGVQVPTGEQVEARGAKDAEVVRLAEHGLLNGHERRTRDIKREHEPTGPGGPGAVLHHPPRDQVPNLVRDRGGLGGARQSARYGQWVAGRPVWRRPAIQSLVRWGS